VTQLVFTVSLAAGPERAVELFGKAVLPRLAGPSAREPRVDIRMSRMHAGMHENDGSLG
jgi:hypothetical protein